jgi:hypothetical protein
MKNTGDGVLQFCDADGKPIWDPELYNAGHMSYFIQPGQTTADVYIKQYKANPFISVTNPQPLVEIPFALTFFYFPQGEYFPAIQFYNEENSCSVYLLDNTPTTVDSDDITNLSVRFGTEFTGQTLSLANFNTYLSNTNNTKYLPKLATKIDLRTGYDSMYQVVNELQKYDNAQSLCDMLIADYVLSILRSSNANPSYLNRTY